MKKVIALILAVCMVLPFTGCGKKKQTAGGVPTLVWLMWGDKQSDNDAVMAKANEITVPAIGAKIQIQYIDQGAYSERMKMNMASGTDSYDLCFTGFINGYSSAAQKGGLLDITEYIEKMPDLKKSIPDYLWDSVTLDGKIYAVPNQQVFANSSSVNIKKDLADEYGLDVDKIVYMEDLEPFLKWVKETHPEVYPFRTTAVIGNYKGRIEKEGIATGISVTIEDGKTIAKKDMDFKDFETYPRLMSEWFKKGYIRKDVAAVMEDDQDYKAGKYAVSMTTWKPGIAQSIYASKGYEVYSKQMTRGRLSGLIGSSTMIGVNRNSKHPEEAVKFIELINTNKDLYNLICFGIEGKHYNVVNDRVVINKEGGYAPLEAWKFGNQFNALLMEGQYDSIWEDTKKFNDEALKYDTIGFSFDNTNVRTEYAQVQKVNDKYNLMNKGVENIDEYIEGYRKEMKMAGIDKVYEELNKQLKDFQSKKG